MSTSESTLFPHRTGSSLSTPSHPSLSDLAADAKVGHIVFRVFSPSSASDLLWTGDVATSGFAALNSHLGSLTPTAYAAALAAPDEEEVKAGPLPRPPRYLPPRPPPPTVSLPPKPAQASPTTTTPPTVNTPAAAKDNHAATSGSGGGGGDTCSPEPWPDWTSGPVLRQTILDHTTKRVRATWDVAWDTPQVGADGLSPWISATADAGWALWEAARRLAYDGKPSVSVAVIALAPALPPDTGAPSTWPSHGPLSGQVKRGASGEVVLDPHPVLVDHKRQGRGTAERGRMTNNEKETVEIALFEVAASREVLFYGRVFAGSIVAVYEFTPEVSPT